MVLFHLIQPVQQFAQVILVSVEPAQLQQLENGGKAIKETRINAGDSSEQTSRK